MSLRIRRAHYEDESILSKGHCSQTWLICGHRIILNWNCGCCCCCCCWIFNDVVLAKRHVALLPSHVAGGRVMFIMFIMFIFNPINSTQITWWSCSTTPPPPGCLSGSWTSCAQKLIHVKNFFDQSYHLDCTCSSCAAPPSCPCASAEKSRSSSGKFDQTSSCSISPRM